MKLSLSVRERGFKPSLAKVTVCAVASLSVRERGFKLEVDEATIDAGSGRSLYESVDLNHPTHTPGSVAPASLSVRERGFKLLRPAPAHRSGPSLSVRERGFKHWKAKAVS